MDRANECCKQQHDGCCSSLSNRWITLAVSLFISVCCSLNYFFSVSIGPLLKKLFDSQETVNIVASIGNIFQFIGLPAGMAYDRYGPTRILAIGISMVFIGYFSLYMILKNSIELDNEDHGSAKHNLLIIIIFYAIGSGSQPWLDASGFLTNVHNFEKTSPKIMGIAKAYNGLGGSIWSSLYLGFFAPSENRLGFVLFTCITATSVLLLALPFIHQVSESARNVSARELPFNVMYVMTAMFAIYLGLASYVSRLPDVDSFIPPILSVFAILFLISIASVAPLLGPTDAEGHGVCICLQGTDNMSSSSSSSSIAHTRIRASSDDMESTNNSLIDQTMENGNPMNSVVSDQNQESHSENEKSVSLKEAFSRYEVWVIFLLVVSLTGTGLVVLNNLSQLHNALANDSSFSTAAAALSSIFGVFNCYGRIGSSYFLSLNWKPPFLFSMACFFVSFSMLMLSLGYYPFLAPSCAIIGYAYGSAFGMLLLLLFPPMLHLDVHIFTLSFLCC